VQSWCSLAYYEADYEAAHSESLWLMPSFQSLNFQVLGACRGVQQCYQPCALAESNEHELLHVMNLSWSRDAPRFACGKFGRGVGRMITGKVDCKELNRATCLHSCLASHAEVQWNSTVGPCWSVISVQSCGFLQQSHVIFLSLPASSSCLVFLLGKGDATIVQALWKDPTAWVKSAC